MMKETIERRKYPMYKDKPYGNNLWAIKAELGLSNIRLEILSGITSTTVARMVRGDIPINDERRRKLERATGYKVEVYY